MKLTCSLQVQACKYNVVTSVTTKLWLKWDDSALNVWKALWDVWVPRVVQCKFIQWLLQAPWSSEEE